ncbi:MULTISPECIES: DUF3134 domain-containing protein [Sphaerospermopsis]|jgi:hypothetical protein|uniref:DUF3134 domain-containing protein n=1 Tax=Sphaerospermopsis torques-reginae ITEP-024 TaxID=984208 RepID=A0ABX8X3V6_9CYAN|nr:MULTISPECIES: DUF3134 domain-containing protein [Sphaerospermopsis]MBE9054703.1 DUF3134 domain-containing protein [Sphaerospermopsis sp. LEGE 08334]QYX33228.1 DUF3134 domain-containing protein [Sphaerospermopsis torques-reginae ITEP-024]
MLNSPLNEQPRNQRATVIPLKQKSSMLDWLQSSGRLIARDFNESTFSEPEEEISDFLAGEDGIGDLDYDDDADISIDED